MKYFTAVRQSFNKFLDEHQNDSFREFQDKFNQDAEKVDIDKKWDSKVKIKKVFTGDDFKKDKVITEQKPKTGQ